ncbi:MAG: hypothetical protein KGJ13_09935, partial [Patescibacteria group bacterium]|nr:hypothetical protein [Patescibacteria group bacterium]
MSTDPKEITLDLPPQPATTENKAPIAGAKPSVELLKYGERGVAISSFEDLFRFAKAVTLSGMAPRGYEKPESVIIAVQMGAEVGLPP